MEGIHSWSPVEASSQEPLVTLPLQATAAATALPSTPFSLGLRQQKSIIEQLHQVPLKRKPSAANISPVPNPFVSTSAPIHRPLPSFRTFQEGVELARTTLLQAAAIAPSEQQTKIMDLLEVFRDYTETGRVSRRETEAKIAQT